MNDAKLEILRNQAQVDGEPWFWTGNEWTTGCGCTYRELAATDDHCDPIWLGAGTMCEKHLKKARQRVELLRAEGRLPNGV